jgi:hypothetical protein
VGLGGRATYGGDNDDLAEVVDLTAEEDDEREAIDIELWVLEVVMLAEVKSETTNEGGE